MSDPEEMIIEITPDEPVVIEPDKPAEKPAKTVETVQIEPIEDLRKQLDTMRTGAETDRAARLKAEGEARQHAEDAAKAREDAAKARVEVVDTAMSSIETAMDAAKTEADAAEAEYKSAYEAGDGGKMAQAQRKIARAEAKLQRLDEGRSDLEARKAEKPAPVERPTQQPVTETRSQRWLREHPQYSTDPKLRNKAAAAHNMALADGHEPNTEDYIDYCEKFLGLKEEPAVTNGAAKPATTRTKAMPSAPVSREAASISGELTPMQVVLTKGEQLAATDGTITWGHTDPKIGAVKGEPVGLKEYGRRKLAMTKEGRYDRSYTDQ